MITIDAVGDQLIMTNYQTESGVTTSVGSFVTPEVTPPTPIQLTLFDIPGMRQMTAFDRSVTRLRYYVDKLVPTS